MKKLPETHEQLLLAFARLEAEWVCEFTTSVKEEDEKLEKLREWMGEYCTRNGLAAPPWLEVIHPVEDPE